MAKHTPFENLATWKMARLLARAVIDATTRPAAAKHSPHVATRLQQTATDIAAKLAVASLHAGSPSALRPALTALRELICELRSTIYIAEDASVMDGDTAESLRDAADSLQAGVADWLASLPASTNYQPMTDHGFDQTQRLIRKADGSIVPISSTNDLEQHIEELLNAAPPTDNDESGTSSARGKAAKKRSGKTLRETDIDQLRETVRMDELAGPRPKRRT